MVKYIVKYIVKAPEFWFQHVTKEFSYLTCLADVGHKPFFSFWSVCPVVLITIIVQFFIYVQYVASFLASGGVSRAGGQSCWVCRSGEGGVFICLELKCDKVDCTYRGGEKEWTKHDAVSALVTNS